MTTQTRTGSDDESQALEADITPEMDAVSQNWARQSLTQAGIPDTDVDYLFGPARTGQVVQAPGRAVQPFPVARMRDYTAQELAAEYRTEYDVSAREEFPGLFKSREDFQQKYTAAPLTHLSLSQLRNMENSRAYDGLGKGEKWVHRRFESQHDTAGIIEALRNGQLAPPIVIKDSDRLYLMSGQTRLAAGLALRQNIPVKLIPARPEVPQGYQDG